MPNKEAVRAEIEAAFGDLPVPRADELLGESTGGDQGEKAIKEMLQGKRWQELDTAFLKRRWSSFGYLSATAYRYYLPALLVRSLDHFQAPNRSLEDSEKQISIWQDAAHLSTEELLDRLAAESHDSDLLHSTLFGLTPGYYRIYKEGHDQRLNYHTAFFSPQQYGAICSFLGLIFEQIPEYKFRAAKALYWGWNRQAHPALEKAQAFYETMNNFTWPESNNPDVRRVIAQIHDSFKDTPYPVDLDGNSEEMRVGDCGGDEEVAEILLEFRGKNWRSLHPQFLMEHETALSFLPDNAFRYFLPVFLIADLMGEEMESVRNANPVFHLTDGLADERDDSPALLEFLEEAGLEENAAMFQRRQIEGGWYSCQLKRFSGFTAPERAAVVAYLQLQIEAFTQLDYDLNEGRPVYERDRQEISQAIERFWAR
jgi:hypothetical protein